MVSFIAGYRMWRLRAEVTIKDKVQKMEPGEGCEFYASMLWEKKKHSLYCISIYLTQYQNKCARKNTFLT